MYKISKSIYYLFITLIIFSCEKDPPLFKINNLTGNEVKAFGHGGMGIRWKYPIDTWEGFQKCLSIGADGTEMDVQMTKDFVLVAHHNPVLEEVTGCSGVINEKSWAELSSCRYRSLLSSNLYLSSIDDVFSRINNIKNYVFTFDCKLYSNAANFDLYMEEYGNAIINIIDKYNLEKNVLIESTNRYFLRLLKNKRAGLQLFFYPSSFEEGMSVAEKFNLFGITISTKMVTGEQIALAHKKGFRVAIWNIETQQDNIDALQKSPDYIQTDKINHLLKILGKYKR